MVASGRWRCSQYKRDADKKDRENVRANPERYKDFLRYQRKYAKEHREYARYKAYRHWDRVAKRKGTLAWERAKRLMVSCCFYCNTPRAGGLDRKESEQGHTKKNSVPCCEKCNYILGDLPFAAKKLFRNALRLVASKKILETWTIPTKRRRKNAVRKCN
jgi:hypothetical protein